MKLIIGLGNPGVQYTHTRHNVGFLMVEQFAREECFSEWKDSKFNSLLSEGNINGEKILLAKPLTYMNLSGNAVVGIMNFYRLEPQDILVLSDDIDMEFGKVRFRTKGSHGGQNGMRDIIGKLSTDVFARVKVGIGRHEHMSTPDWVLSRFRPEELEALSDEIYRGVESHILKFLHAPR